MTEAERALLMQLANEVRQILYATNSVWGSNDDRIGKLDRLVSEVEYEVAANAAIDQLEREANSRG